MSAGTAPTSRPHTDPTAAAADPALANRSVDRALAVLCSFSPETPALGVTEISERLDLTKSTVHRLLQALAARGLVVRDPDHRHYALGYRVLALARAVQGEASLQQICRPHLHWLRSATEETIALYVAAGDVRMCLEELESPQMLRMSAGVGRCFPLDLGAASKALLFDGAGESDVWRRATSGLGPARRAALASELEMARAHGYAVSHGETVPGAASIAAPVFGANQRVVASVNVGGPSARFTADAVARHAAALLEAVSRIGRDLGAAHASHASHASHVSPASPASPDQRHTTGKAEPAGAS